MEKFEKNWAEMEKKTLKRDIFQKFCPGHLLGKMILTNQH